MSSVQITTEDRMNLGARLAGARKLAGKTQLQVAEYFGVNKATVSAWEKGRGVPDALTFRELVKYYNSVADALLWDDAVGFEAMQFAADYEHLSAEKRATLRMLWVAFVADGSVASNIKPLKEKTT